MIGIQTLIVTLIKEIRGTIIKGNHRLSWMPTVRSGIRFCFLLVLQANLLQLNWIEWEPILITRETLLEMNSFFNLLSYFLVSFLEPCKDLVITALFFLFFYIYIQCHKQ